MALEEPLNSPEWLVSASLLNNRHEANNAGSFFGGA